MDETLCGMRGKDGCEAMKTYPRQYLVLDSVLESIALPS